MPRELLIAVSGQSVSPPAIGVKPEGHVRSSRDRPHTSERLRPRQLRAVVLGRPKPKARYTAAAARSALSGFKSFT